MQLPDQHIDEFISLYKREFGIELSKAEAQEKGSKLCDLVRILEFDVNNEDEYGIRRT